MPQDPAGSPSKVQIVSSLSKAVHPMPKLLTLLMDPFVETALESRHP